MWKILTKYFKNDCKYAEIMGWKYCVTPLGCEVIGKHT